MMKNAIVALAVLATPVFAQEKEKPAKPAGRNESLRKAFRELAAKGSGYVVKVGGGAYGVILEGRVIATTSAAAKGAGRVAVKGPKGSGEARVLGVDEKSGVALLECPFEAKGIELADTAALEIGQYVVTIGTEDEVVCAGVLSAKDRHVEPRDLSQANIFMGLLSDGIDGPKRSYPKVLQHDAPMTDEILGTALVDSSGKLVGMNVGTGYRGSSYAIAARDLLACATAIKGGKTETPAEKKAGKPWLGASVKEQDDGTLVVDELVAGGPAAQGGVKVGDRIYAVDAAKVTTLEELAARIGAHKPGESIELSVLRDGEKTKVSVKLGEK